MILLGVLLIAATVFLSALGFVEGPWWLGILLPLSAWIGGLIVAVPYVIISLKRNSW